MDDANKCSPPLNLPVDPSRLQTGDGKGHLGISEELGDGRVNCSDIFCDGEINSIEDLVKNLVEGTPKMPPRIRVGADEKGTFLEAIQPSYFLPRFAVTTAQVLKFESNSEYVARTYNL